MLALTVLVSGHCFDFNQYIRQSWNNMSGMTQANRSVKKRGKSIMKLLKFESLECRRNARGNPS